MEASLKLTFHLVKEGKGLGIGMGQNRCRKYKHMQHEKLASYYKAIVKEMVMK